MNREQYIAVIPARGGSKQIPRKNLRKIGGKPLISWTISQALNCPKIDLVHVSTDDEEIAELAREFGADVPYLRPPDMSGDNAPTEDAMAYAVNWYAKHDRSFENTILLQPTSPVRLDDSIAKAIETFETHNCNSLVSVVETHSFFWLNEKNPTPSYDFRNRPMRQNIKPHEKRYRENGSIYITKTAAFLENQCRIVEPVCLNMMQDIEGFEIDSELDLSFVDHILRGEENNAS